MDVFEGERFILDCIASVYAPERINDAMLKYSFYKNNLIVTGVNSITNIADRAYPWKNGNYSCKVQLWTGWRTIIKESRMVVLNAKGEVRLTLALWCFYFGRGKESSLHVSMGFYGDGFSKLQDRDLSKHFFY